MVCQFYSKLMYADPITSVKFSQDGHCQLVSSLDNNIRLLDKDSGELLNTSVITHSYVHPSIHTHKHSHSRTHSLTHSHTQSLTHPQTQSLTHKLTHIHSHSLTHKHSHSLTNSLTNSLTYSLTYTVTHSLTNTATHSLTHSLCVAILSLCMDFFRYKGHKGSEYKIDSSLTHDDACIVSGSEDGKIYFWELVEVTEVRENCVIIVCLLQSTVVQTLQQLDGRGRSSCVVYSLSYHPSKPCLLTVGSQGPVRVWKREADMKAEEEEDS